MVASSEEVIAVLSGLSELDKAILRCAAVGLTSKEISPLVGRSHHTIDDRLKTTARRLGSRDRHHAGRMLLLHESGLDPLNGWVPQSPVIAFAAKSSIVVSSPRGTNDNSIYPSHNIDIGPAGVETCLASAQSSIPAFASAHPGTGSNAGVRTTGIRAAVPAVETARRRHTDSELVRDTAAVSGPVRPLGSPGPGHYGRGGPTDLGLRIGGEDASSAVCSQQYADVHRYSNDPPPHWDREHHALKAVRLMSHLLVSSLACGALILLVITCFEAAT